MGKKAKAKREATQQERETKRQERRFAKFSAALIESIRSDDPTMIRALSDAGNFGWQDLRITVDDDYNPPIAVYAGMMTAGKWLVFHCQSVVEGLRGMDIEDVLDHFDRVRDAITGFEVLARLASQGHVATWEAESRIREGLEPLRRSLHPSFVKIISREGFHHEILWDAWQSIGEEIHAEGDAQAIGDSIGDAGIPAKEDPANKKPFGM